MRALVILAIAGSVGVPLSGCLGERIDASSERTIHVQAGTPQNDLRFDPQIPDDHLDIARNQNLAHNHQKNGWRFIDFDVLHDISFSR